jgi:cytochrome c556
MDQHQRERNVVIRMVITASALAAAFSVALAQDDPIAARQALMKSNGQQAALGAKMVKGEEPFDLAKAKAIFVAIEGVANKAPTLFPENSKTGGDTAADPKIWSNMDDFKAMFAKLGADAKAAQSSVKDLESFKAAFGNVGKDCGGCHQTYRIKKS